MNTIATVQTAVARGMAARPKIGGFPHLAEALRQAGVRSYHFDVASASVTYVTDAGIVLQPGHLLRDDWTAIGAFDEATLIAAIRADQQGASTFPEFVEASFRAGVVRYVVDTGTRTCTYLGLRGERYVEDYPAVELADAN